MLHYMLKTGWNKNRKEMDIIVTTPKTEIASAAKEAADAIAGKVEYYFRRLSKLPSNLKVGDKVWYIEDGYIRGYAIVSAISNEQGQQCNTTNKNYASGVYVWMRCDSWTWIKPIKFKGLQGYCYAVSKNSQLSIKGVDNYKYDVIGDWKSPKPALN